MKLKVIISKLGLRRYQNIIRLFPLNRRKRIFRRQIKIQKIILLRLVLYNKKLHSAKIRYIRLLRILKTKTNYRYKINLVCLKLIKIKSRKTIGIIFFAKWNKTSLGGWRNFHPLILKVIFKKMTFRKNLTKNTKPLFLRINF
jgi:hypothetical protein